MSPEGALKVKNFVQSITERPAPIESQPFKREGIFTWCDDWELIELGKCLFMGKEVYLGDPPPRRLKFNPLFDQAGIVQAVDALLQKHGGDADKIIEELETRRKAYAA